MPDALVLLFRPTVQPYLISWFRHDPAAVLGELEMPALVVHGTADSQVDVGQARLLHAGKPDARLVLVEGMDHLLAVGGDIARGTDALAQQVADWLQELDVRVAA